MLKPTQAGLTLVCDLQKSAGKSQTTLWKSKSVQCRQCYFEYPWTLGIGQLGASAKDPSLRWGRAGCSRVSKSGANQAQRAHKYRKIDTAVVDDYSPDKLISFCWWIIETALERSFDRVAVVALGESVLSYHSFCNRHCHGFSHCGYSTPTRPWIPPYLPSRNLGGQRPCQAVTVVRGEYSRRCLAAL